MGKDVVVNGATIQCTGSPQTSFLVVPPSLLIEIDGANSANIDHHVPFDNILPFGPCILQPGQPPCVPLTPTPWSRGETSVVFGRKPVLDIKSKCKCARAPGVISIVSSGQSNPFFSVDGKASPYATLWSEWDARQQYAAQVKAQMDAENEADRPASLKDQLLNTARETGREFFGDNPVELATNFIPFGKAKHLRHLKKLPGALKDAWKAFRGGKKAIPKAPIPRIHHGKQGKHIPGHNNYHPRKRKSILTANPDDLAGRAGTGTPVNKVPRGQPGYRERVNFGKVIGYHVNPATGIKVPTTNGIIHHAKDGIHIIPSRP